MSRQSDPVPALDRSHLLFQILYDDYLTAFLVGESGQTEGIHENLRQSTVKPLRIACNSSRLFSGKEFRKFSVTTR